MSTNIHMHIMDNIKNDLNLIVAITVDLTHQIYINPVVLALIKSNVFLMSIHFFF